MFWLYLRDSWLTFITFGLAGGDVDPKRRGTVVLFRRDNGHDVLTYEYSYLSEVEIHALSLASRLPTTHVFDPCRELGVSMDHVAGAGTDEPLEPVVWREIAVPLRYAPLPPRQPPW